MIGAGDGLPTGLPTGAGDGEPTGAGDGEPTGAGAGAGEPTIGVGLIVTCADVCRPRRSVAVKVYVVIDVGLTVKLPAGATVPMPGVIATKTAFCTFQISWAMIFLNSLLP